MSIGTPGAVRAARGQFRRRRDDLRADPVHDVHTPEADQPGSGTGEIHSVRDHQPTPSSRGRRGGPDHGCVGGGRVVDTDDDRRRGARDTMCAMRCVDRPSVPLYGDPSDLPRLASLSG
ncbi:hypothetical protein AB4305_13240 [Nocardia sp. 2YAB30]|uniref:hypothetical protein n=1 Tax=unclassified Nocardia TaxID=2637762 RepID=UPI003F95FC9F